MLKSKQGGIRVVDEMRPAPFRKLLKRGLRAGLYTLRFYGEPGSYKLGIQRGNTIFRILEDEFAKSLPAQLRGYAKYRVKPAQYRGKKAA